MSKIKKLISILASAVLCFATFALVACNGDESSSTPVNTESSDTGSSDTGSSDPGSEDEELNGYLFTVNNADGTAASNVFVQLCTINADGSLGSCFMPIMVNNGTVEYTFDGFTAGVYEIHLLASDCQTPLEYEETNKKTPASYSEITLTIAD